MYLYIDYQDHKLNVGFDKLNIFYHNKVFCFFKFTKKCRYSHYVLLVKIPTFIDIPLPINR